ncbi:hypothetical protein [Streptomyces sp. NPDC059168]|uniref:hypothetical protein n=1 Tax=Streptomyces sp. NPDC059168 TaxID=3346753 RepID=UPI0036AF606B
MPANRFWEMEDSRIDLGSVDAAPHDLGRLMMVAYATAGGNVLGELVVPAPTRRGPAGPTGIDGGIPRRRRRRRPVLRT